VAPALSYHRTRTQEQLRAGRDERAELCAFAHRAAAPKAALDDRDAVLVKKENPRRSFSSDLCSDLGASSRGTRVA
jgi:hypothetical protein